MPGQCWRGSCRSVFLRPLPNRGPLPLQREGLATAALPSPWPSVGSRGAPRASFSGCRAVHRAANAHAGGYLRFALGSARFLDTNWKGSILERELSGESRYEKALVRAAPCQDRRVLAETARPIGPLALAIPQGFEASYPQGIGSVRQTDRNVPQCRPHGL